MTELGTAKGFYQERLSYLEISQRLSIKPETAQTRVSRALTLLREFFKTQDPDSFGPRSLLFSPRWRELLTWLLPPVSGQSAGILRT